MLTHRGWWFLFFSLLLLAAGVITRVGSVLLLALTLLLWFLASWLLFNLRLRWLHGCIRIERQVGDEGLSDTFWAKSSLDVRVRLVCDSLVTFPLVRFVDRVPALARWQTGSVWTEGLLTREAPLATQYRLHCPSAGRLRFYGLKLQWSDVQGLFIAYTFLRQEVSYRVLPPPVDDPHALPVKKRHHMLPLLGQHRFLRPGTGSELLDLRDYMPGDPPKMIAWKASARRDRLITKEFESEVPIRCTLFVDTSSSVRLGPIGENALARLVEIASATAYAQSENRDLIGLCLFDETGVQTAIRPGRGRKFLLRLLSVLADVTDLPPAGSTAPPDMLLSYAYGLALDLYPDRMDAGVNHCPWHWPRFWLRKHRWRKRLAALFAVRYKLGPGGVGLLMNDQPAFERMARQFLADHQVSCPLALVDEQGRSPFALPPKVDVLAKALMQTVARGQENELFVLMVDLLDLVDHLEPLLRAVRMARARHHQVLVVVPWPAGVPKPGEKEPLLTPTSLQTDLFRAQALRLADAYESLQRAFLKRGVPVLCAAQYDVVPLILRRIQHLRGWQTR
jgi:uncharacterized protein (DUF58 family)